MGPLREACCELLRLRHIESQAKLCAGYSAVDHAVERSKRMQPFLLALRPNQLAAFIAKDHDELARLIKEEDDAGMG